MIARSQFFLLIGLMSALVATTTTCVSAGGSGDHGSNGGGQLTRNGGGMPNGGPKTMSRTNLGGAERELGKIVVNGVTNGGRLLNGSLGTVGRAGAARGQSHCGGGGC